MKTPKMKAVLCIDRANSEDVRKCRDCNVEVWGESGLCKKHSHFVTRHHMTLPRFLYWKVRQNVTIKTVLTTIINTVLIALIVAGMIWGASVGLERSAVVNCHKLEAQSVKYAPHFFLTENENAMCDEVGIHISAPIR